MASRLTLGVIALDVASCAASASSAGSPSGSSAATIARSSTPAATVRSSAPAATATSNPALLRTSFGVIYWGARQGWEPGSAPQILPEGRTTTVGQLAGSFYNQFHGAVSQDGRRAIYAAQPEMNGPWGYYLLDGPKPTEQRRLLALPNENLGAALWSPDLNAVALTAQAGGAA